MPEVSPEVLAAARLAAGFSAVPEPELEPRPVSAHDVTEPPPRELGGRADPRPHPLGMHPANRDALWDSVLSALEGTEKNFVWAALDR